MKRLFLFLSILFGLLLQVSPSYAGSDKIFIDFVRIPKGSKPRTPEPSIYAYIEDGLLTVSIDRYLGFVSTMIEDANGAEVDNDSEYICGASTYVMNVSALTSGTYIVYFIFSDGREYYGTFTME